MMSLSFFIVLQTIFRQSTKFFILWKCRYFLCVWYFRNNTSLLQMSQCVKYPLEGFLMHRVEATILYFLALLQWDEAFRGLVVQFTLKFLVEPSSPGGGTAGLCGTAV